MYRALYRRFRPKTFKDLLGQEHITTTLKNQIINENIGHGYLFSGTRGTGKTSAARIFARAVNCLDLQDGEPCNSCENCIEILNESTVDIVEMDAASHNSVNDIRELKEKVIYPPTNIKKKVYIIDEVHMLSTQAFNAFLKILEEPPSHLIFILATTEPEKILQTILSRCQRFDFKRIQSKDIILNMEKIIAQLDIEVDKEVLSLIARNADGAMRDALSLLDQCVSFSEDRIEYSDALDLLGITNRDIIFELVDNLIEKKLEEALNTLDSINASGKDINQLVKDLINHFRNLMIVKSSKNPESIIDIDNIEAFKAQSENVNIDFILESLNLLVDAENKGRWSGEIRLILEMALINMVDIEEKLSLRQRVERLEEGFLPGKVLKERAEGQEDSSIKKEEKLEEKTAKEAVASKSVEDPAPSSKTSESKASDEKSFINLDLETIKNHWDVILKEIKAKKISLYALIREGKLIEFNNNQLEINYDEGLGFHHGAISKEDNKEFVEEIISKYFNIDIVVSFTLGSLNIKPKEDTKDQAINKVVEVFGEDIVEIK